MFQAVKIDRNSSDDFDKRSGALMSDAAHARISARAVNNFDKNPNPFWSARAHGRSNPAGQCARTALRAVARRLLNARRKRQ